jgi:hypothetical protein
MRQDNAVTLVANFERFRKGEKEKRRKGEKSKSPLLPLSLSPLLKWKTNSSPTQQQVTPC